MKSHIQDSAEARLTSETTHERYRPILSKNNTNKHESEKTNEEMTKDNLQTPLKGKEEEATEAPDGGWGWMVVLGCFLITSIIPMVGPCFGILFSQYLLRLGTSSTMTAWIFNTQCFIWNVMALITRPLTHEFGWRTIGVFGALLTSISFMVSAFAPNAEFLFFSFSLLCGTGGGSVTCICFTILPHYFSKHRGVANAVMMGGICLGQVLAPPLVQTLQEEYGFTGATIIVGALMLNGCIGASFFHPVEWHTKKSHKLATPDLQEGDVPLLVETKASKFIHNNNIMKSKSNQSLCLQGGMKEIDWVEVISHARRIRMADGRHISDASHLSLSSSLAVSTIDIAGIGVGYTDGESTEPNANGKEKEKRSIFRLLVRIGNSTISDLQVLKSPRALIMALGATFCINGYINFIMMVPFAMQVAGYHLESSAWCISVSAVCNLLMRILVSSMSDWARFNVKAVYFSGFVVIFITTLVFPFLTDLRMMMIVMAIWGGGVGINMGLYNLVMISVMGLDNLAPVFGSCSFMVALGFVTVGPIIGMVRDASQSYSVSMWMVSGMLFASIVLWCFMPAAQAYDKKKAVRESQCQETSSA